MGLFLCLVANSPTQILERNLFIFPEEKIYSIVCILEFFVVFDFEFVQFQG